MLNAKFSLRAIKDLENSSDWYESRSEGLGQRFIFAIKKSVSAIENNPEGYSKVINEYRQAVVYGFPFVVVYRYNKDRNHLIIVSVFHTSRDPKHKYRRK